MASYAGVRDHFRILRGVRYGKLSFSISEHISAQDLPRTVAREAGPFRRRQMQHWMNAKSSKHAFVLRLDCLRPLQILPNVKDEPRRHLARRVRDSDQHSNVYIRSFVRMHAA
jgi:hypothetical protein